MEVIVNFPDVSEPPARQLYRVKTDREIVEQQIAVPGHGQFYEPGRGVDWRDGDPMVFWLFGGDKFPFDEAQQRLAWDMLKDYVPIKKFSVIYDDHRAFMNNTGFWNDQSPYAYDPRRNYITGEDINSPLPEWDKVRVCGNAIISGVEDGDWLIVETIDPDNVPTWDELKPKTWLYFAAVSANRIGDAVSFPQGDPVYIPLISRSVVRYPLSALERI